MRLRIPAIGVSATVERVSVVEDGTRAVPKNEWNVGWYRGGYVPGTLGNAVMAGHLDWTNGPAVFWNLKRLKVGDTIYVTDSRKVERKFIVQRTVVYPFDQAPLDAIYGKSANANLNLITCAGKYDRALQNYDKRLVVYTTLAEG